MARQTTDPREIVAGMLDDARLLKACAKRDMGTQFRLLNHRGVSTRRLAAAVDITQGRLYDYSRLTIEDVEVGAQQVRLHLGHAPIQLPEPVAALARSVAANRKGHASIGALAPSPWFFPGGQPGRPISTTQLTQRLNQLGIRPNQTRKTALRRLGHPRRRGQPTVMTIASVLFGTGQRSSVGCLARLRRP